MSKIHQTLLELKKNNQKAFVPFITAGDPNLDATLEYIDALTTAGATVIELGIPFSDPMADGPTNQKAAQRALSAETTLESILQMVSTLRDSGNSIPIVLFSYLNPIYKMGFEKFCDKASDCGVDGVLLVDLPPEGSESLINLVNGKGIETIFLASPTTASARLPLIEKASSGFVYYVSRTGVTGEQKELSQTLVSELRAVKKYITRPIMVGFGISNPDQAKAVAEHADGVVIGSALVKIIEQNKDINAAKEKLGSFCQEIIQILKG